MLYLFFCLTLLPYVYGGSQCKRRSDIYPCICLDRSIGKGKFDTTIICQGLNDATSILTITDALKEMEITKFLLYDSYWNNRLLRGTHAEPALQVPMNYVSGFRMEEIEMVDTDVSFFGCATEYNCRTNYLKRFTAINTTLPDKSPCDSGFNFRTFISCPGIIEYLTIDKGMKDSTLKPDFFPEPLPKLKELHLPHNQISKIERRTFSLAKFPALKILDLSDNSLRDAKHLFAAMLRLEVLDLSSNSLRTIVEFQYLPHLKSLKLQNNQLSTLVENEWQNIPSNLRLVDFTNNILECSCGIQFLNSTFHINTNLIGSCFRPEELRGKKLRKSARFYMERCDEEGNVGPKKPKAKKVPK